MGIGGLLRCFTPGVESGPGEALESSRRFSGVADVEEPVSFRNLSVNAKHADVVEGGGKRLAADGTVDGINNQHLATLPPLPFGKRLSKRKLAKLRKAEEEAEHLAKAEEEETMSQYLGKSGSCSSLNSLPRVLSSSSVSRCATPERRGKEVMVQFDGEGKVVVRNRQSSFGSEASWSMSEAVTPTPSSLMGTPECSDLRGVGAADGLEMSDLTSVSHSMSVTDFSMSIDAEGHEIMEFIPKAIRSVSNPRFGQLIVESIFKTHGGTVVVGGGQQQRGSAGHAAADNAELRPATSGQVSSMRRNVSWSHTSQVDIGLRRSTSETALNRRHTVLVLTNVEDDCATSDEEEAQGKSAGGLGKRPDSRNATRWNATGSKHSKSWEKLPMKVSQVFESHHVHLHKLQDQMGDASRAPEDLLQLMSRKIFDSRSDIASSVEDMDEQREGGCSPTLQTLSSHDLSDCSDRLPKIRTRSVML